MNSLQQVARALCVPIAMGLFLIAAQAAGGLQLRDFAVTQTAMR